MNADCSQSRLDFSVELGNREYNFDRLSKRDKMAQPSPRTFRSLTFKGCDRQIRICVFQFFFRSFFCPSLFARIMALSVSA